MPQSKKKALYNTNDKIPENMKCPVCMELLLSPIYQCEVGHNICHSCIENVEVCPLCKGDYGDTRNYFAEELVNSSTFPCKFEEYGCTCLFHGSELKAHQDGCTHQPYRCPELACKETSGRHQMSAHLDRHRFPVMEGQTLLATIDVQDCHFDKKIEYNPWRISTFYREFYAVTTRRKDGFWYLWTWILGLPDEAKKYSAEISLLSGKKDVIWRGPVHSLRVSPEDIIKGGNCLVVGDNLIKSLRENGQIKCGIRFIQGKNWTSRKAKITKKAALQNEKLARKRIQKIPNPLPETGRFKKAPALVQTMAKTLCIKPAPSIEKPSTSASMNVRPKTVAFVKADDQISPRLLIKRSKTPADSRPKTSVASAAAVKVKKIRKPSLEEDSELIKKLQQSLRCPGCRKIITPPVFQCCIGHNLCSTCRSNRTDCPLCRAPLESTRNFFAEEVLYAAYQKCQFHSSGCKVCLPCVSIRQHEAICDFAPFECPFDTCYQKFSGKELFPHLMTHRIPVSPREVTSEVAYPKTSSCKSTTLCAIPAIVQYNNIGFYPTIYHEKNGSWAFWVTSHEHRSYQYELVIRKQFKTLVFHGPVVSLRMSHAQIKANGNCLITHDRVMKTMKNANGKFEISVRIMSTDGRAKLPESFAVPLYFKDCTTDEETMKLFASSKTSENALDASDEEGSNGIGTMLNRDDGDTEDPFGLLAFISDVGDRLAEENSQLNQSASDTSHEHEEVQESGSDLCIDLDSGTGIPSPPQNSMTDIAALTDALLTCESNSTFLKQKYREEHLQQIHKMRLFLEFVKEELARPPETRTLEQNENVVKIMKSLKRAEEEVNQLNAPDAPALLRLEQLPRMCENFDDFNENFPQEIQDSWTASNTNIKSSSETVVQQTSDQNTELDENHNAVPNEVEETSDDGSLKIKKSCLKIGNSSENLTATRSKQQLRVTFAAATAEEDDNNNKKATEDNPQVVGEVLDVSTQLQVALNEATFSLFASAPPSPEGPPSFASDSWNAECDLIEAKDEKKQKKKNKRKNKNKKLQIAKKKAQLSLLVESTEGAIANENGVESSDDQQPLAYTGSEGVPEFEFSPADENNNGLDLEQHESHSNSSLVNARNSSLLINLDDDPIEPIQQVQTSSHLQESGSDVDQISRDLCSSEMSAAENDSQDEDGDLDGNYDSLHSLCLAHGLHQQGETNEFLSYTALLQDLVMSSEDEAKLPKLSASGSNQVQILEEVDQACQVGSSLMKIEQSESAHEDVENDNNIEAEAESIIDPVPVEDEKPLGNEDEEETEESLAMSIMRGVGQLAEELSSSAVGDGAVAIAEEEEKKLEDEEEGFALTITKSIGELAGGIYTSTKGAVTALFTGYDDDSDSVEEWGTE